MTSHHRQGDPWTRLLIAAAAVLAVAGIVMLAWPSTGSEPPTTATHHPAEPPTPPTATSSSPTTPSATPQRPVGSSTQQPSAPAPSATTPIPPATSTPPHDAAAGTRASVSWQQVAHGYAADLAAPGTGHDDWLTRIRQWTSPQLAAQHESTAEERIPAAHLLGVTAQSAGPTVADLIAEYDTGLTVAIRVELDPHDQWHVTSAAPVPPTR